MFLFHPHHTHFSASREMISVVDRYFSLNRTLLLIIGLWPYQKSILARFQLFCYFGTVVSLIIFQFATFITSKCTTDHIIRVLSLSFTLICSVIKYNSFCVNSDTVKCLIEQLQYIYDNSMDSNEIAIMDRYGDIGKRFTIAFTMCFVCCVFVIFGGHLMPIIINIILPANESRPRHLLIPIEYFINQEKYYYLLLLHVNAALFISVTTMIATGAMLIALYQHACGMFEIARFSEYLTSEFEITYMLLMLFGVIASSLSTFRILPSEHNIPDLFLTFSLTAMIFTYMFLGNWIGQEITDHSDLIFAAAYETQWYITPLSIQKLILFLLLRGNKTFVLNMGGLFIASIELFTMLINTTMSYVILMNSIMR